MLKVVELDLKCKVEGESEAEKKFGYEITKFERIHKYERNQTT